MLNLYVCEDQIQFRKRLWKMLEDHIEQEGYDIQMTLQTEDPYEVLDACKNSDRTGIYFLDVDLKTDINGIQLAEKIRKHDSRGFIIFITTHAEMTYLTFKYKVEALDYIIKDDLDTIYGHAKACLRNIVDKYKHMDKDTLKTLTIKLPDRHVVVPYDSIQFFETSATIHKVNLHAIDRQLSFYGRLTNLEEELDERFVRCHRSYLVNTDAIKEIDYKQKLITMVNGQQCYLSSRGAKRVKEARELDKS